MISNNYPIRFSIVILGYARLGKSRFAASLVEDELVISKVISSDGLDHTKFPMMLSLERKDINGNPFQNEANLELYALNDEADLNEFKADFFEELENLETISDLGERYKYYMGLLSSNDEVLEKYRGKLGFKINSYMSDFAEGIVPFKYNNLVVIDTEGTSTGTNPVIVDSVDHKLIFIGNVSLSDAELGYENIAPHLVGSNTTYMYSSGEAPSTPEGLKLKTAGLYEHVKNFEEKVIATLSNGAVIKENNLLNLEDKTVIYYNLPSIYDNKTTSDLLATSEHIATLQKELKKHLFERFSAESTLAALDSLNGEETEYVLKTMERILNLNLKRSHKYKLPELMRVPHNLMGRTKTYDHNNMQVLGKYIRARVTKEIFDNGLSVISELESSKEKKVVVQLFQTLLTEKFPYIVGGHHADNYPRYCQDSYIPIFLPFKPECMDTVTFFEDIIDIKGRSNGYLSNLSDSAIAVRALEGVRLLVLNSRHKKPMLPSTLEGLVELFAVKLPIYGVVYDAYLKQLDNN